ncbi:hypothetical protein VM1G_09058 [Cytospora mali]|uniref:Uncharacterized protein n=1 Tax=Cytospora mali TaxID=578113 RepID=A0A194W9I1_CYTMA|nr:hypothetical protein VM1G_09058 [Valsa mali]
MNENRDHRGLHQRLNPLLTSSIGSFSQQPANTPPISALSFSSNPHNVPTPVSAMQPYDPREWIPSPMPGSGPGFERGPQPSAPESTGSALPPPPYSPPRSQRPVSMYLDGHHPPNAVLTRAQRSQTSFHRPSPEPSSNQSFPPPPNTRGSSRERRFGLPSFGRRREPEATPSPESSISSGHHRPPPPPPPTIIPSRPAPLTIQIPQFGPQRSGTDASPQGVPPSSRRAVSTSAIDTPTSARSRSASQTRWNPNVPLPPPPPGPPPAHLRSQSTSRDFAGSTEPVASPPTRRPPPSGVTALGPVPPTPANWVDEEPSGGRRTTRTPSWDRGCAGDHAAVDRADAAEDPSAALGSPGLNRSKAVRGEKTLRERRNESRTRSSRLSTDASISDLDQIMIPPSSAGLSRKMTIGRRTPKSAEQSQTNPRDGSDGDNDDEASGSTPKALDSARRQPGLQIFTPPFSPRPMKAQETSEGSTSIVPKALPTPPPHSRSASKTRMPVEPVIPTPVSSKSATRNSVIKQSPEQFSHDTVDRFQAFAQREATAADDAERVRLFAEFIVSESRIRRERYSAAISAMGSEIFDLTRDLFRPMAVRRESTTSQGSEWTPQSSLPSRSHRGSLVSVFHGETSKQEESSSAPTSASIVQMSPTAPPQNNANWNSDYRPTLSPILSMSVSDNHDDDSRGRPASRWWESASSGEQGRWERSKRESKYMSVPKEAHEALQWMDSPEESSAQGSLNEYPPEKQGWHEQQPGEAYQSYTPQPAHTPLKHSLSLPNTPHPHHEDISRLVTLPPPYPRHHPAVNNNHPNLAEIRASVRTLSELSEVDATKDRFSRDSRALRDEAAEAASKRRQALRLNLQQEVGLGRMTYGEAAAIEADSNETEKQTFKDIEKKDFDRFQTAVVIPLNDLLTMRIGKATQLFDDLRSRLFVETREPNPNMPQEEGDEHPELLEKLTLLKWIFEARELLHRAVYDLLSDRNERYREMVITPYRLAGNEEKLAHAAAFFAEDAGKRAFAFASEVLQRTSEFRDVVEENVVRGVEMQLSAFWDIAPPLCRLLDRVPLGPGANGEGEEGHGGSGGGDGAGSGSGHNDWRTLADFRIQIPQSEIVENPSYVDHPLQYFFSLLLHAEKSTYQFIESQTNLLCLLHEVKEAVVVARARVMEEEGRSKEKVEAMRREEGRRLTDDLKEKVRAVQDQWGSALGDRVTHVKERVGEWLLETGGWDESLEERGVGSL